MTAELDLQAKILIIDDTPNNLRILSKMLSQEGYQVLCTTGGHRILETVIATGPQLILLDIMMPEIDGYDVCQKLKAHEQTCHIPVIFLSALSESADKVKAFKMGGVDYISKPYQLEEVIARIENQLALQAAQAHVRRLNSELEKRVIQRTAQLEQTNQDLKREIVERKQAQAALSEAKDVAEVANRTKSQFLANMSHELRTPLNAILGFTQLLLRSDTTSPQQLEQLEIVNRSGEHLLALINDILEMSKIEAGRIALQPVGFNLRRFLDNLERMLTIKAHGKGLELIFDCASEVPRFIKTDESKLRQILINLLGNGIKFTQVGKVRLTVSSSLSAPRPDMEGAQGKLRPLSLTLHFAVEDTGPGIAPEEVEGLFDVFTQTETGRRSQEGTGLGLAISQQFAQLMGGTIRVTSQVNQGSVFKFSIPVEVVDATEVDDEQLRRRVIALEPGQPTFRILVVEDQLEERLALLNLLTSVGFVTRTAQNGQEALDIWESWQPHLIWMDLRMPVMDGLRATKRIRSHLKGQTVPIIALTASVFEPQQTMALAIGCSDFVTKPLEEGAIFGQMARHLDLRYIYATMPAAAINEAEKVLLDLEIQDFATMEAAWVAQVHQAAISAREKQLTQLIAEIPPEEQRLADALRQMLARLDYDKIAHLTEPLNV